MITGTSYKHSTLAYTHHTFTCNTNTGQLNICHTYTGHIYTCHTCTCQKCGHTFTHLHLHTLITWAPGTHTLLIPVRHTYTGHIYIPVTCHTMVTYTPVKVHLSHNGHTFASHTNSGHIYTGHICSYQSPVKLN